MNTTHRMADAIRAGLGLPAEPADRIRFTGCGSLPSRFPVSDLAAASMGVAGSAVAGLVAAAGGPIATTHVDRVQAARWFQSSIRPIGWQVPAPWDPLAGDYRGRDGWIRLHTNAPHHRAAALQVLGVAADRDAVARAVAGWSTADLETAVVAAGGCAAQMRSAGAWRTHPQGRAVAQEPLAIVEACEARGTPPVRPPWPLQPHRPLAGIRVLDATRVLAGPVATRFLAGFGADVLRVDPPGWEEPSLEAEVTLGKRCARLDLRSASGVESFRTLLSQADVLVHGLRPGALDALGLHGNARRRLNPALVDVCLDAYGWSGPWAGRRGFDSLVQMSCGIAAAGMAWQGADRPVPLPVQALDHATGYLMAAVAVAGLQRRLECGGGTSARLSLARTARLLEASPPAEGAAPLPLETEADALPTIESTAWGPARRLAPAVAVGDAAMGWTQPAAPLGSAPPAWSC